MEDVSSSEKKPKIENSDSDSKPSLNTDKSKVKLAVEKSKGGIDGEKKNSDERLTPKKSFLLKEKTARDYHSEQKHKHKKQTKVSDITNKHRPKTPTKKKSVSLKDDDLIGEQGKKKGDIFRKEGNEQKKSKPRAPDLKKDSRGDGSEMPSMSFEACLSYDVEAPKRKKKSCGDKHAKRLKMDLKEDIKVHTSSIKPSKTETEAPAAMVAISSIDLVHTLYLFYFLIRCISTLRLQRHLCWTC